MAWQAWGRRGGRGREQRGEEGTRAQLTLLLSAALAFAKYGNLIKFPYLGLETKFGVSGEALHGPERETSAATARGVGLARVERDSRRRRRPQRWKASPSPPSTPCAASSPPSPPATGSTRTRAASPAHRHSTARPARSSIAVSMHALLRDRLDCRAIPRGDRRFTVANCLARRRLRHNVLAAARRQRRAALYVELDQDEVVQRKCAMISTKPALKRALEPGADARVTPSGVTGGPDAEAGGYRLLSCNLNSVEQLEKALASAGWSASEPTLVIAECVLVYLVPDASKAILDFFGRQCSGGCVFVGYEMIGPDDPFGRTMLDNLRRRGCPLLGLPAVPDCKAQESRSLSCGFTRAEAMDVLAYYEKVVGPKERQRVNKIEMFDELEEWRMLLTHYCVSLGVKDAADGGGGAAAAALLSEVRLGKEVVAQPLVGLVTSSSSSSAAAAAADVSDPIVGGGEPNIASGAAAVVQPPQPRAPPLGNSFPEDEEDAVWSDEEEEQQQEPPQPGGGAPAGA